MRSVEVELTELVRAGAQQVVGALRRVASEDLSVAELTHILEAAFGQRNQIDFAVTSVVGVLDRKVEQAADDGVCTLGLSAATWLSHTLHISDSAAHAQVRLARELPLLQATAAAFERGELSGPHASVVARSVAHVVRGGGEPVLAERMMLEEAENRDPRGLLRWGLGLLHRMAPQEMEAEEERRHQRRYLHLSEVFDGGFQVEGYLDPIAGARFKTALDGVLGPRVKGDERSPGQRRADGLDELVTRVLDSGKLPGRGGERPHLTITASLETLKADPGAPAALLDWGFFPISGKALRQIATDGVITPILVDPHGDPLHVGRKYRTATRKMRKALAARDQRCIWPGCNRAASQCQADHEQPWANGGGTDLQNMRLLCPLHHAKLSLGWRLERLPNRQVVVHPPVNGPPSRAPAA